MTIFSMTATFGGLKNETLRLRDGLNILEEANEGGKSTWCAFLRAMFYGLESRKGGANSEKNRYTPWSGAAMRGEMELSWQGQHITLHRFAKGASPFGGFRAVYTGTEEPVPGLTADNVGEVILGVSKEVFQRTCFIAQGGIQVDASGDLERRVAALATSGQEDVSFSDTERRLKDWRNAIQSNRSNGKLPRLRQELEELQRREEQARQLTQRMEDAQGALDELERQKAAVEEDIARHIAQARQSYTLRYEAARAKAEEAEADYRRKLSESESWGTLPSAEALRKAQGDLAYLNALANRQRPAEEELAKLEAALAEKEAICQQEPFGGKSAQQVSQEAESACEELNARHRPRLAHWTPMLGCAACALALWAVGLATKAIHMAILLGAGGGAVVAGVAISLCLSIHARSKREKSRQAILTRYGVSSAEELRQNAQNYARHWAGLEQLRDDCSRARRGLEEMERERQGLWQQLKDFCAAFAPEADTAVTFSAALARALARDEMLAAARREYEAADAILQAVKETTPAPEKNVAQAALKSQEEPVRSRSEDEALLNRIRHGIALYSDQLAHAQGELSALGAGAQREEALRRCQEAMEESEAQYAALSLALETLTAANATLQSRFSPAVNEAAGEIMSRLTGGRYSAVSFTREFQALADSGEGLHASQFLSQGTADQTYLALRLAICRLTFFQEELPPMVLDDALVTFDDQRLHYALELLSDLSEDRQVLLFTCQNRERLGAQRLDADRRSRINLP